MEHNKPLNMALKELKREGSRSDMLVYYLYFPQHNVEVLASIHGHNASALAMFGRFAGVASPIDLL